MAWHDPATGAFLARGRDGLWTAWVPEGERVFRRERLPLPLSAAAEDALREFGRIVERAVPNG